MCSPVRKAAPSTSVTTVGWPPTGGPTSITRHRRRNRRSIDGEASRRRRSRRGRGRIASRADVPEPHGDRSTSPSAKTVTLRWARPSPSTRLPEDDAVDAREVRLVGVDDLERAIERGAELALQGDQLGEGSRLDMEPERPHIHRAVERATERDVEGQRAAARLDLHVAREHERGDVPEAHGLDPTGAVQASRAREPARRDVDRDADLAGARLRRDATACRSPRSRARSCRARTPSSSPRCGRTRRRDRRPRRRVASRSRRTCRRGRAAR